MGSQQIDTHRCHYYRVTRPLRPSALAQQTPAPDVYRLGPRQYALQELTSQVTPRVPLAAKMSLRCRGHRRQVPFQLILLKLHFGYLPPAHKHTDKPEWRDQNNFLAGTDQPELAAWRYRLDYLPSQLPVDHKLQQIFYRPVIYSL